MASRAEESTPSTSESAKATAQSRSGEPPAGEKQRGQDGTSGAFTIGPAVIRAVTGQPYERDGTDVLYRPLRIYTVDPSLGRKDGAVATVNVPYEPLEPGPAGAVFEVDNKDGHRGEEYRRVDLDDPRVLIEDGLRPSPSDPRFHQQMVYAVCSLVYAAFRTALGRHVAWGFPVQQGRSRLLVRPHALDELNAYYDHDRGELCFGYAKAKETNGTTTRGYVFTCLSHDVIAHEVTHALIAGVRSHFNIASGRDAAALHEALADLIAIFQHFSYKEVVRGVIRSSGGRLDMGGLLTDVAPQVGQAYGQSALRSGIDSDPEHPRQYKEGAEEHETGAVLASAVIEAFTAIYKRKSARFFRLATQGTGVLPPGQIPHDLEDVLADQASKLADQFQRILIRALDYCPPVDPELGNYLRGLITADYDLVPDDPWGYREVMIAAFARRGIYPRNVPTLSEDAILWKPPIRAVGAIADLSFAKLQFDGDPGRPAGKAELERQAAVLGRLVSQPDLLDVFGLAREGDARLRGDRVELPQVESIRSSRRVGPDGQVVFDLIGEVTQLRHARMPNGELFAFYGGATIIIGPRGEVRFVINKNVASDSRLERETKNRASGLLPSMRCSLYKR
ncbi:MAG TPA: peptidase M4, partial [Candidatus Eisenbacteria bacterium]|nr:peptidase M4 [Candidatus Eisenbacteria bacterium]